MGIELFGDMREPIPTRIKLGVYDDDGLLESRFKNALHYVRKAAQSRVAWALTSKLLEVLQPESEWCVAITCDEGVRITDRQRPSFIGEMLFPLWKDGAGYINGDASGDLRFERISGLLKSARDEFYVDEVAWVKCFERAVEADRLLVCDVPSYGLDPVLRFTDEEERKLLKEERQSCTLISRADAASLTRARGGLHPRVRNYEYEADLAKFYGGKWVVAEWCPMNGEHCYWGSFQGDDPSEMQWYKPEGEEPSGKFPSFGRGDVVEIGYKNWAGKEYTRVVNVFDIWFGETEYHKGLQAFMKGAHRADDGKVKIRDYAIKDIVSMKNLYRQKALVIDGEV